MKKINLEFLFPNIDNERKYKWLQNAPFTFTLKDTDIVSFDLEEFLYRTNQETVQYCDNQHRNITDEKQKKMYETWREASPSNIFTLDKAFRWDNSICHQLAVALEKNPLAIPHFIQDNAVAIVGRFLGQSILGTKISLSKKFGRQFFLNKKIDRRQYKLLNFEAKYSLSLYLSVLNELLDFGVNLQEYPFGNLEACNSYGQLGNSAAWNEYPKRLLYDDMIEDYVRCDGQSFTKEELISYLNFDNLHEFLNTIMSLTEIEYNIEFINDAITIDPDQIMPINYFLDGSPTDMSYFPKEKLVDIKTLCKKLQAKLKRVAQETEKKLIERKLKELTDRLEEYTKEKEQVKETDYTAILEEINKLCVMIQNLPSCDTKAYKKILEDIINENQFSKKNILLNKPNLDMKISNLEKRMETIEEKIDQMETDLLNYLEHGGKNPIGNPTKLNKEEQIKIVSNFQPKSHGAKLRKALLLGLLKVGALGLIIGTLHYKPKEFVPETHNEFSKQNTCNCKHPIPEDESWQTPSENISSQEETVTLEETNQEPQLHSLEEIILEVIHGDWGDGQERYDRLTNSGYNYREIQSYIELIYDIYNGNISLEQYEEFAQQYIKK